MCGRGGLMGNCDKDLLKRGARLDDLIDRAAEARRLAVVAKVRKTCKEVAN